MSKVKIISNPYESNVFFLIYNPMTQGWMPLEVQNPDSKLRQEKIDKVFLPFRVAYSIDGEKTVTVFRNEREAAA